MSEGLANDHLDAAAQWQNEGWVLLEGLIPRDEIGPALAEARAVDREEPSQIGPIRQPDRHAGRSEKGPAFRSAQFLGNTLFPVSGAPNLNRLFVHPAVRSFATTALATDDIRIYQSRLWSKFGEITDYEQPLHRDQNHSVVPTRSEAGWWFLECFLYLSDVTEENGAPRLVPRSASDGERAKRGPISREDGAQLYDAEVSAPGPAGSLLAYRSDVWHRGTDLAPGSDRHVLVVAFKPAGLDWVSFDAHGPLVNSPDFVEFVNGSTPEELALFGVPSPGHPFWTDDTVEGMAGIYPGLDLEPWRAGLTG